MRKSLLTSGGVAFLGLYHIKCTVVVSSILGISHAGYEYVKSSNHLNWYSIHINSPTTKREVPVGEVRVSATPVQTATRHTLTSL